MQILSNIDDIYSASLAHHLALSHSIKAQIVQALLGTVQLLSNTD